MQLAATCFAQWCYACLDTLLLKVDSHIPQHTPKLTFPLTLEGVQHKLFLKNVGGFGLSPSPAGPGLKLAGWVPEGKGAPGFVGIWDVASLGKAQDMPAPLARRSFFRVCPVVVQAEICICHFL